MLMQFKQLASNIKFSETADAKKTPRASPFSMCVVDKTTRGRPIIGADIKHFTDYRYRPF